MGDQELDRAVLVVFDIGEGARRGPVEVVADLMPAVLEGEVP